MWFVFPSPVAVKRRGIFIYNYLSVSLGFMYMIY